MIDLMKDDLMTDQQIDKRVVELIRQKYSLNAEQKLSRIAHRQELGMQPLSTDELVEIEVYEVYVNQCRDEGKTAKIKRDLLSATIEYEKAVKRLNRYLLEDGRSEQIVAPIYKEGYEDLSEEERPILEEGYTIKGIDPIEPLMIDQFIYDDDGNQVGVEQVVNPIIQKDRDEREAAQLIVDAVTQEIIDLTIARGRI